MSYPVKNGQTSVVLRLKLLDSSSTTGAGLTGLSNASSGLIISTIADNESSATAYTVAGSTVETITTLGTYAAPTATKCRFKEVDSTNHKGVYELQFADARFAVSSAKSLLISVLGATNLAQADFVVPLVSDDPYVAKPANYASLSIDGSGRVDVIKINSVSASSVTAINANVGTTQPVNFTGTAGSALVKSDMVDVAGAAVSTSSAQIGVNVVNLGGTAQTGRDIGASVLLSSGTGAGQISLASGTVTVGTNNDKTGYALTSGERNSVADALLDRDMSTGTDSGSTTVRTVRQALRALRNKWAISSGTLTIYKEDDATSSWTAAVTGDATANPIVTSDPAG
jgi:hypothetical protein